MQVKWLMAARDIRHELRSVGRKRLPVCHSSGTRMQTVRVGKIAPNSLACFHFAAMLRLRYGFVKHEKMA